MIAVSLPLDPALHHTTDITPLYALSPRRMEAVFLR
jgi:hypothetical protein